MFQYLVRSRFVTSVAVIFTLINSIVFTAVGVAHCVHGYVAFINAGFLPTEEVKPGLMLLEGLDSFMIALVFLIFGLGVARLFLFDKVESSTIPGWLDVKSLKELKILLWETILVTLVIVCVSHLVKSAPEGWEALIFPVVILVLAMALFLLRLKEKT